MHSKASANFLETGGATSNAQHYIYPFWVPLYYIKHSNCVWGGWKLSWGGQSILNCSVHSPALIGWHLNGVIKAGRTASCVQGRAACTRAQGWTAYACVPGRAACSRAQKVECRVAVCWISPSQLPQIITHDTPQTRIKTRIEINRNMPPQFIRILLYYLRTLHLHSSNSFATTEVGWAHYGNYRECSSGKRQD